MVCFVIGIVGIIFMLNSKMGTPFDIIGVILCILLIVFGFISTGKWGEYIGSGDENFGNHPIEIKA